MTDPTDLLSPVADGVYHPLDPRVIPLQRLVGWIVAAVIAGATLVGPLGGLTAAVVAGGLSPWALPVFLGFWAIAIGTLTWHLQRWPAIAYRHASYRLDPRGLEIRRGVFWRKVINVPRSRVQHIDVSQGPLERRYGLGTLVIHTAGAHHAQVNLGGLDHAVALRLREHLLPGTGEGDAV